MDSSFLVAKAMTGTQFVAQFCAHKKPETKKPVALGRQNDTNTWEQFLPRVLLKRAQSEKVTKILYAIHAVNRTQFHKTTEKKNRSPFTTA